MYTCPIDAEPLDRYKRGGYHPIRLGSSLCDGRYKIIHKLGWGGYSTVWAARDQRKGNYVAVKICVSETGYNSMVRELNVLKELASRSDYSQYIMRLIDNFQLDGPNGTHCCLVFELLGPSVPDMIDMHFSDGRLPGALAKAITKQALLGLDFLHQQKIAHGDLHTRNFAFVIDVMENIPEQKFVEILGKPETGRVYKSDGKDLGPGMPQYIVRPARRLLFHSSSFIKIIDFGESFLQQNAPQTLHAPLPVRAPEVIFGDHLDYRVDLWSLGCMIFELFVGQPPFDSFLLTTKLLVDQMRELTNEPLPERWQEVWEAMSGEVPTEGSKIRLQEWLEEMYFDGERNADLTGDDILKLGHIIQKLLRFEPSARASAREILNDPWFRD
ncbi:kinase-like domain-containing protein [Aspergillus spinulosporus]